MNASLSAPAPERDSLPLSPPWRVPWMTYVRRTRPVGVRSAGPPSTGRRAGRVCSPRCRIARWRQARVAAHAAELAQLHAENIALRQRVAELERLVG